MKTVYLLFCFYFIYTSDCLPLSVDYDYEWKDEPAIKKSFKKVLKNSEEIVIPEKEGQFQIEEEARELSNEEANDEISEIRTLKLQLRSEDLIPLNERLVTKDSEDSKVIYIKKDVGHVNSKDDSNKEGSNQESLPCDHSDPSQESLGFGHLIIPPFVDPDFVNNKPLIPGGIIIPNKDNSVTTTSAPKKESIVDPSLSPPIVDPEDVNPSPLGPEILLTQESSGDGPIIEDIASHTSDDKPENEDIASHIQSQGPEDKDKSEKPKEESLLGHTIIPPICC